MHFLCLEDIAIDSHRWQNTSEKACLLICLVKGFICSVEHYKIIQIYCIIILKAIYSNCDKWITKYLMAKVISIKCIKSVNCWKLNDKHSSNEINIISVGVIRISVRCRFQFMKKWMQNKNSLIYFCLTYLKKKKKKELLMFVLSLLWWYYIKWIINSFTGSHFLFCVLILCWKSSVKHRKSSNKTDKK